MASLPEQAKDATADKVKRVELAFLPNQSREYNLSSTQLRKRASLTDIGQLTSDGQGEGSSQADGGTTIEEP